MLQDHGKAPHECSSTYLDIVPRHQEARRWKTLLFIHTQVSPHTSAHVQRRAFQHRVRAAFQWRGPADDHHLGEHRLRGHREPGAHLQERHHQRLVALAALSTCCLNGFSPWSLDLHWHNFGFSLTYSSHSDGLFSCAFILCWTRACVLRSLRSLIVILQSDFQSGLFFFVLSQCEIAIFRKSPFKLVQVMWRIAIEAVLTVLAWYKCLSLLFYEAGELQSLSLLLLV